MKRFSLDLSKASKQPLVDEPQVEALDSSTRSMSSDASSQSFQEKVPGPDAKDGGVSFNSTASSAATLRAPSKGSSPLRAGLLEMGKSRSLPRTLREDQEGGRSPVPGPAEESSKDFAKAHDLHFAEALVRGLREVHGQACAELCALRREEARAALAETAELLTHIEDLADSGEPLSEHISKISEAYWLCDGLGRALKTLEENSRAEGEGEEVMAEYEALEAEATACELRLQLLAEQWQLKHGGQASAAEGGWSFGGFLGAVFSPFLAMWNVGGSCCSTRQDPKGNSVPSVMAPSSAEFTAGSGQAKPAAS